MGEEKHALIELRKDDCQTDLDADSAQFTKWGWDKLGWDAKADFFGSIDEFAFFSEAAFEVQFKELQDAWHLPASSLSNFLIYL